MKKQVYSENGDYDTEYDNDDYDENLYYENCTKCNILLIYDYERDIGICYDCQDSLIQKYNKRKEWDHYHNDD